MSSTSTDKNAASNGQPPPNKKAKSDTTGGKGADSPSKNVDPTKLLLTGGKGADSPTKLEQLMDTSDVWLHILSFVGPGHFIYLAGVSRQFKELYQAYFATLQNRPRIYDRTAPGDKKSHRPAISSDTLYRAAFSSVACAKVWKGATGGVYQSSVFERPGNVCGGVARHGNLEVLNWALQQGFELNEWACRGAALGGQLEILKWLHEKDCTWNKHTCAAAARHGHLNCLQYLHEQQCPWNKNTCAAAASNGHLECLRYAHDKGCRWGKDTCTCAAESGHLECLKYAHENGCRWGKDTCTSAAQYGHLECLKYAHENRCPWDEQTCLEAATNGHLECLKFAHQNGCPLEVLDVCQAAARHGHLEILKFVLEITNRWNEELIREVRYEAVFHPTILEWLHGLLQKCALCTLVLGDTMVGADDDPFRICEWPECKAMIRGFLIRGLLKKCTQCHRDIMLDPENYGTWAGSCGVFCGPCTVHNRSWFYSCYK